MLHVDEMVTRSKIDTQEANRANPLTDTDDPKRVKLLNEILEPKFAKDTIDVDDPNLVTPVALMVDPTLAKAVTDSDEPK